MGQIGYIGNFWDRGLKGAGPKFDFIHTVHVDRGWIEEQFLSLDHACEMRRFLAMGQKRPKHVKNHQLCRIFQR